MVLINIYAKIEPIIISKKLGVGICNPASDWVEAFCEDEFEEEILIHNYNLRVWDNLKFNTTNIKEISFSKIVNSLGWQEKGKSDKKVIAEHLVEIQVIDFENSYLMKKNEYMNSPTCETQYTTKFIKFCSFVTQNTMDTLEGQVPFVIYDSNELREKPWILNYVQGFSKKGDLNTYTQGCIKTLNYIGNLIDNYIVTDDDFWLFDYLLNAVYDIEEGDGAYHIFKVMSLIEMLIVNYNKVISNNSKKETSTKETKRKLPQFIDWDLDYKQKQLFANIVGDLRNKIAHGNFKEVQVLLEKYRNCFMKNFWYDEYEYSIENWTYNNITLKLDRILANILWLMIYNKKKLIEIRKS